MRIRKMVLGLVLLGGISSQAVAHPSLRSAPSASRAGAGSGGITDRIRERHTAPDRGYDTAYIDWLKARDDCGRRRKTCATTPSNPSDRQLSEAGLPDRAR